MGSHRQLAGIISPEHLQTSRYRESSTPKSERESSRERMIAGFRREETATFLFADRSSRRLVGLRRSLPRLSLTALLLAGELLTVDLVALRTQPMTEVGSGVIPDIALHLHPAPVGVPDLLALHTDWQYSTKIRQFSIPCLVQCPLGLDSVCNIDATAYIAPKLTVLAKERRSGVKDPPIILIMALQAILHLKWLPLLECVHVRGKALLQIITMNALSPSISALLFQAASSELEPAVVEVIALSGRIGTPNHDRRLLHQSLIFVSGKSVGDHCAGPLGELHRPLTSDELFTLLAISGHTGLYL
jgi:hypothetical protein